jgi:hypothetical protein
MTIDRSRTPVLVMLLAAIAVAGALVFADGRDLVHRRWTEGAMSVEISQYVAGQTFEYTQDPALTDVNGSVRVYLLTTPANLEFQKVGDQTPVEGGVLHASGRTLGWLLWTALPTGLATVAVLALLVTALIAALRGRSGDRVLRTAGWIAVIGGPVAAGSEELARLWMHGYDYTPSANRWLLALVLVLVGSALLAVRAGLSRISALRTELDGVI